MRKSEDRPFSATTRYRAGGSLTRSDTKPGSLFRMSPILSIL